MSKIKKSNLPWETHCYPDLMELQQAGILRRKHVESRIKDDLKDKEKGQYLVLFDRPGPGTTLGGKGLSNLNPRYLPLSEGEAVVLNGHDGDETNQKVLKHNGESWSEIRSYDEGFAPTELVLIDDNSIYSTVAEDLDLESHEGYWALVSV